MPDWKLVRHQFFEAVLKIVISKYFKRNSFALITWRYREEFSQWAWSHSEVHKWHIGSLCQKRKDSAIMERREILEWTVWQLSQVSLRHLPAHISQVQSPLWLFSIPQSIQSTPCLVSHHPIYFSSPLPSSWQLNSISLLVHLILEGENKAQSQLIVSRV